jgi:ABC-type iron transport system FetAB ATPase subunit
MWLKTIGFPVNDRIKNIHSELMQQKGVADMLNQNIATLQLKYKEITDRQKLLEEVHTLLSTLVLGTERGIMEYLSPIVTEALHYVFEQDLRFCIEFVTRRNQIEVDFFILRSKEDEDKFHMYLEEPVKYERQLQDLVKEHKDINFMYGGAINQVIALVLRLVMAEFLKIQGPIFLDEPSSAVGDVYTERLGKLLASLSERFNRQIVLITHSEKLASFAEKQYLVYRESNVSKIRELTNT